MHHVFNLIFPGTWNILMSEGLSHGSPLPSRMSGSLSYPLQPLEFWLSWVSFPHSQWLLRFSLTSLISWQGLYTCWTYLFRCPSGYFLSPTQPGLNYSVTYWRLSLLFHCTHKWLHIYTQSHIHTRNGYVPFSSFSHLWAASLVDLLVLGYFGK